MNKSIRLLLLFFVAAVSASAQGSERKPVPAEWENAVKAAKAEREVAVFCEPTLEAQNALMQFQKAYPDIQLNLRT